MLTPTASRGRLRRLLAAVPVALAVVLSSATAATAATSPASVTDPDGGPAGIVEGEVLVPVDDPTHPTAEEVAAQRQAAAELAEQLAATEAEVEAARTRLVELSQQAGAALEAYETALRERDIAVAEQQHHERRLAEARRVLGEHRSDLGRWASQTYRDGGALTEYEGLMTVLTSDETDDLAQRLAMLQLIGRAKGEALITVRNAEEVQREATQHARAATLATEIATARAEEARLEAELAVEEQRTQLAALDELLASTSTAATQAEQESDLLARARAVAEQLRMASEATRRDGNAVTGAVGECTGGDVARYPNGTIPVAALCPLWGYPGHALRADAAHGFNALSESYGARFGEPLCVTDSYRTLDSQIRVYATKPALAAIPGTSNHGWGTAVDLCGGIQVFGSQQHRWMQENAPLYGFFHPTWAQQGGSRPEPWHWEYGG